MKRRLAILPGDGIGIDVTREAGIVGNRSYDDLFRWGLLIALICLGAVILWDYGYLNYLLEHPALSTSFPLNTILKVWESP